MSKFSFLTGATILDESGIRSYIDSDNLYKAFWLAGVMSKHRVLIPSHNGSMYIADHSSNVFFLSSENRYALSQTKILLILEDVRSVIGEYEPRFLFAGNPRYKLDRVTCKRMMSDAVRADLELVESDT